MTVVIALLCLPLLPDYPNQRQHRFFPRNHQLFAEWRIRKENAGIKDEDPESIFWGLKQALIDPKLYMFIALQMALITAQSFNNFFPSIVGTLVSVTVQIEVRHMILIAPPRRLGIRNHSHPTTDCSALPVCICCEFVCVIPCCAQRRERLAHCYPDDIWPSRESPGESHNTSCFEASLTPPGNVRALPGWSLFLHVPDDIRHLRAVQSLRLLAFGLAPPSGL